MEFKRTKEFLEWEYCGKCKHQCFPEFRKNFWHGETYEQYVCDEFDFRENWNKRG